MNRTYFAFQFKSGRNTSTGTPNRITGRMSTAGTLRAFRSAAQRDAWVAEGCTTSDMTGNCREAISAKEARRLCAGSTTANFQSDVEYALACSENE